VGRSRFPRSIRAPASQRLSSKKQRRNHAKQWKFALRVTNHDLKVVAVLFGQNHEPFERDYDIFVNMILFRARHQRTSDPAIIGDFPDVMTVAQRRKMRKQMVD